MWWKNHKYKVIIGAVAVAVLVFAFWYGGNSPGSTGWSVADNSSPPPVTASGTPEAVSPPPGGEATPDNSVSPTTDDKTPESPSAVTPYTQTTQPVETVRPSPSETPTEESAAPSEPPPPSATPAEPEPSMVINPETGTDKYSTGPVPEGKPVPVEPQDTTVGTAQFTCTISIGCSTILDNMDYLDKDKWELVPEDGWILKPITVTFYEGESVLNILQRTCKQQKIHMEFVNVPIYNSAYIEGINNLYEFDVGEQSGWMYSVNGWFPNYGCSRYQLKDGDVIEWLYTCDLGHDVGGGYAIGG